MENCNLLTSQRKGLLFDKKKMEVHYMIYRISQNNTSDNEILQMVREGILPDFEENYIKKEGTTKFNSSEDIQTLYHNNDDKNDNWEKVYFAIVTLGLVPVVDSLIYMKRKLQQKVREKKDAKIDIITVPADEIFLFKDRIKEKVVELAMKGHKVSVVIDGFAQKNLLRGNERIEYNFKYYDLVRLCDLNDELKHLGLNGSIKFNEYFGTTKYSDLRTCWDLEQVVEANNEIEKIVRKIQSLKLSPYETMVYIHKYLTQNYIYKYNVGKISRFLNKRKDEKNRSIVAAILNKQTICAGYASMIKAIIDRLNIRELTCDFQVACCFKKTKNGKEKHDCGHALNLITIEDSKYNIKGSYLNDATWDAKTKKYPYGRGYTYFMYPCTDMAKLTSCLVRATTGSRAYNYSEYIEVGGLPKKGKYDNPIPFDIFEKAVMNVYSLESSFCHENNPNEAAINDIQLSLRRAWGSRKDYTNPLVKKVEDVFIVTPYYKHKKFNGYSFTLRNQEESPTKELAH